MPELISAKGQRSNLLDNVAVGVLNGSTFALPAEPCLITWGVIFPTNPGSITVQLQASLDATNWATIDTSTAVATGSLRSTFCAAPYIRARVNAVVGGDFITVPIFCKSFNQSAAFNQPVTLFTQAFQVGTGADLVETTLASYDLPANLLIASGRTVEMFACGKTGANANNKTLRAKVGANTQVILNGAVNNGSWWHRVIFSRRNVIGNEIYCGRGGFDTSLNTATVVALAISETAPINFSITGQNGTAVALDCTCEFMEVTIRGPLTPMPF